MALNGLFIVRERKSFMKINRLIVIQQITTNINLPDPDTGGLNLHELDTLPAAYLRYQVIFICSGGG